MWKQTARYFGNLLVASWIRGHLQWTPHSVPHLVNMGDDLKRQHMSANVWQLQIWAFPDSKVHGANMGPIWGRQDPGGPHFGPMNFALWVVLLLQYDDVAISLKTVLSLAEGIATASDRWNNTVPCLALLHDHIGLHLNSYCRSMYNSFCCNPIPGYHIAIFLYATKCEMCGSMS